jgi:preprotein translocase subunit SecF
MKIIQLIPPDVNIKWVDKFPYFLGVSILLILISLFSLGIKGLKYGLDFSGGALIQVKTEKEIEISDVRKALKNVGFPLNIQNFEGKGEFIIKSEVPQEKLEDFKREIMDSLDKAFGDGSFEIRRVEMVGPKVGRDLRRKGTLSVISAIIAMLIYITLRFEFRFGIGAIIALIHDVIISLGAISIFNISMDLVILAALLTIAGYSVNDTIIICDRIREMRRKEKGKPEREIINSAINRTLSRTILTVGTTLLAVIALLIFGGGVIHDFAFVLLVGFISGTYSSISIAVPFAFYIFGEKEMKKKR